MNFKNELLTESNKKYSIKKPSYFKILAILFYFLFFVIFCDFIFNVVFIKAQVVGTSMIPTYNIQLKDDLYKDSSYYLSSEYKDIVFANRFDRGTNNDVILLKMNNDLVIKRIIATSGQTVLLKKGNGTTDLINYYYYIDDVLLQEDYIFNRSDMNTVYFNRFCNEDNSLNRNFEVEIIVENEEAQFVVPQGQIFVLGDNRLVSGDSIIYGTISIDNILGKVCFSYKYNQNIFIFLWDKLCSIL